MLNLLLPRGVSYLVLIRAPMNISAVTVLSVHLGVIPKGSLTRGQTAEARKTAILPVEQKTHSQKDRQDEKAEGYVPDEGTR